MSFEEALREYFLHSKGLRSAFREGRYMVVENLKEDAEICMEYLKKAGKDSFWIKSVFEAMDYFEKNGTDGVSCIIIDYFLGHELGEDLVKYMDEKGFCVPVFLYTGCEEVVSVMEKEMPFLTPLLKGDEEKFFKTLGLNFQYH